MSEDWLVRGNRPLELPEIVRAAGDVVPELSLRADRTGHSVVIVHEDEPVVWIGQSREVADPWAPWVTEPASAGRAGQSADRAGQWWTEITGPTDRPVPGHEPPQLLVQAMARALATTTDGTAVRLSAASVPEAHAGSATTTSGGSTGRQPSASALPDPPGDMVNQALAVLVQSRPVVALTPWLVNNHVWASTHQRQFVLLTPAATELTLAAWSYLQNTDAAWVVDTGDSMFHGLIGLQVSWTGAGFELTDQVDVAFTPVVEDQWRVLVEAETTHSYEESATIGTFSRDLLASIDLAAPVRQGLMEPPESSFDVGELTTYARTLSPNPSRFVLQGPGWEAVCEAVPQPIGVVERLTLSATAGEELLDDAILDRFLHRARESGADSALVGYRRGSAAGQVPSRLTGPTVPAALHLSRARFPTLRDAEARRLAGPAVRLDDRAIQLTWSLAADEAEGSDAGEVPEQNPAVDLARLLDAVQHHDSHRHAAASPSG
ncbi:MAG: DUF6177 family protein [Propionibacteriaceae bacterium]